MTNQENPRRDQQNLKHNPQNPRHDQQNPKQNPQNPRHDQQNPRPGYEKMTDEREDSYRQEHVTAN